MFETTIGVDCEKCGKTDGSYTATGRAKCNHCGRFAEETDDYCGKHNINVEKLTGYDKCPKCNQRHRIERAEQERQARRANPRMHPMVDAPRW